MHTRVDEDKATSQSSRRLSEVPQESRSDVAESVRLETLRLLHLAFEEWSRTQSAGADRVPGLRWMLGPDGSCRSIHGLRPPGTETPERAQALTDTAYQQLLQRLADSYSRAFVARQRFHIEVLVSLAERNCNISMEGIPHFSEGTFTGYTGSLVQPWLAAQYIEAPQAIHGLGLKTDPARASSGLTDSGGQTFLHDLVNDASGIQIVLDLLLDHPTRREQSEYLEMLQLSVNRLLGKIRQATASLTGDSVVDCQRDGKIELWSAARLLTPEPHKRKEIILG